LEPELLDLAALHALGLLTGTELRSFEAVLEASPALQSAVRGFQETVSAVADLTVTEDPPDDLKARVLAQADGAGAAQPWKSWADSASEALSFVAASDEDWEPSRFEGIHTRRLFVDHAADRVTMMVRMAPGTSYPAHRHASAEECFVLSGDLWVDDTHMRQGDYQRAEAGSVHPVQKTDEGCVLLLVSSLHDEFTESF